MIDQSKSISSACQTPYRYRKWVHLLLLVFAGIGLTTLFCGSSGLLPSTGLSYWIGCLIAIVVFCLGIGAHLFLMMLGWSSWLGWRNPCVTRAYIPPLWPLIAMGLLGNIVAENSPAVAAFFAPLIYVQAWRSSSGGVRYNLGGVPLYFLYKDLPYLNLHYLVGDEGLVLLMALYGILTILKSKEFMNAPWFFSHTPLQPSGGGQHQVKAPARSSLDLAQATHPATPVGGVAGGKAQGETRIAVSLPAGGLQGLPCAKEPVMNSNTTRRRGKPGVTVEDTLPPPSLEAMAVVPMPNEVGKIPRSAPLGPAAVAVSPAQLLQQARAKGRTGYLLPGADLLTPGKPFEPHIMSQEISQQSKLLEETLMNFGIEGRVCQVHVGPRLLSFEVQPAVGVKVQRIKALESDIALNMEARSIRILAPIPGKAAVGIELPSKQPQEVNFRQLVLTYAQSPMRYAIPLILGKTVTGEDVMVDLAKMPHMIIAGATGSGKSVCINTIIMSILLHASPDEIRLLMIDPKKVELTPYTRLPHMIAPVVTEPSQAAQALAWLVGEMERRYEILKQLGMRHVDAFNQRRVDEEAEKGFRVPVPAKLPFIVAIIDELADLMMTSPADIETPIARIAQMARAVGIHLVIATQRPSREVITGLIKANFPARIAFKVSSRVNSQIILDEVGAECLLGNGDMLFLNPSKGGLIRAQGAFVRDEDITRVVESIELQSPPNYLIKGSGSGEIIGESYQSEDELFEQARQLVVETGTASTTFLQRKLRIGYARAASLMDELHEQGIVGPQESSGKPRRVLGRVEDQEPSS